MNIKRPTRKRLIQFVLLISIILIARMWQQQDLAAGIAPSFISKTLSGEIVNSKPLPNEATLVHFWATWCGICRLENDNIQALDTTNYRIFNIALKSGTDDELKKYAKAHNMRLDNIINDNTGTLAKLFGVHATPSSFFIDSKGRIKFIEVGYTTTLGYRLRLWLAAL